MKRLQFDFSEEKVKELDDLANRTGLKTRAQLFNSALSLFEWAIREREAGRIIASMDEKTDKYKEVLMPGFPDIREEDIFSRAMTLKEQIEPDQLQTNLDLLVNLLENPMVDLLENPIGEDIFCHQVVKNFWSKYIKNSTDEKLFANYCSKRLSPASSKRFTDCLNAILEEKKPKNQKNSVNYPAETLDDNISRYPLNPSEPDTQEQRSSPKHTKKPSTKASTP